MGMTGMNTNTTTSVSGLYVNTSAMGGLETPGDNARRRATYNGSTLPSGVSSPTNAQGGNSSSNQTPSVVPSQKEINKLQMSLEEAQLQKEAVERHLRLEIESLKGWLGFSLQTHRHTDTQTHPYIY